MANIEKISLVGKTLEEIETIMSELGERPYRARQIFAGLYHRRARTWAEFSDLGKSLRQKLDSLYTLDYPMVANQFISKDGTRRYLFSVGPAEKIESVLIPEEDRDTFCISTQVGCAVACLYCVTGKLPLRRNLTAGEIVGQILALQTERTAAHRKFNVVFMGMGEPLHNYDHVMKALRLMTDRRGIGLSPRRITLSTAGVVPGLERLATEAVIPNLAISLSATTDKVRDLLVPINRKWNIAALLETCRRFPLASRRRITFEYVLIESINDTPEDAHRLARLLAGLKKKVNLIPLNSDPWVPLKSPDEERIRTFQKILVSYNLTANLRRPRGEDISAACGMLAGRETISADPSLDNPLNPSGSRNRFIEVQS